MKKNIFAILLATVMCLGVMLMPAFGAGTGKAIQLVQNGSAPNITGCQASNIYFGNYNQSGVQPVKWRVLANKNKQLFVLSDMNLDSKPYNTNMDWITWERTTIRSWLNGYGASENNGGGVFGPGEGISYENDNFINTVFSSGEQAAIAITNVKNDDNPDYDTEGGNDTKDKIFLLSIAEVHNKEYFKNDNDSTRVSVNTEYAENNGAYTEEGAGYWWLRSPGNYEGFAAYVSYDGKVSTHGNDLFYEEYAVRPAFNLNLDYVLFTSAAEGGKASGTVGPDSLNETKGYSGTDWKMTVKDDSRRGFTASLESESDNMFTIKYSGAKTGDNEYISAVIVNNKGEITYYGKLCTAEAGNDKTAEVNISGKYNDGDTLYIFNEQANGNKMTDYASELKVIMGTGAATTIGDVNGDGDITQTDKLILSRYLAKWDGYDKKIVNWDAADINKDKDVTQTDKLILSRYLAKWEGYEQYFK
ncbi:MAG: hypothetical protein IJF98_03725 [Firmicutes bacterium]|nr:hypothetical protein [Bacillota bacterium]